MDKRAEPPSRTELAKYVSSGVQVLGIDAIEAVLIDVLVHTQARHVLSVGSGEGVVEAALRLPQDTQVYGIDPDPTSFMLSTPPPDCVPLLSPAYPTIDELMQDECVWPSMQAEGIVLLVIWPPFSDGSGYDIDAVERLRPRGVVSVCDPTGFSGSNHFVAWLRGLKDCSGGCFPKDALPKSIAEVQNTSVNFSEALEAYTLTHDYRRPGYLGLLPPGTFDEARKRGDIYDLSVQVPPGETLGITWDGNTKVLRDVKEDSPLAVAGGGNLIGWRLTLLDGKFPRFPREVDDAARRGGTLQLQFMRDPVVAMLFSCTSAVQRDACQKMPLPKYQRGDGLLVRWPL